MKKIISVLLVATLSLVFASCGNKPEITTGTDAPVALPSGTQIDYTDIVVGLDENFPPMGFKEDGKLVGFDIDLATAAGEKMGVKMTFQPINWSSKELELTSKKVDLLWNGFTITEKRKESVLFTKPYLKNKQIVMVLNNSPIKTKADLSGKTIGLQKDSSAVDAVSADETTKSSLKGITEYDDNIMAFQDLIIGRVDAVVVDEIVAKYYLSKNKTDIILLEDNFGSEEYGVGMRKEDTALQEKLQKALDDMNKDGTTSEISKKWFGEDIVVK